MVSLLQPVLREDAGPQKELLHKSSSYCTMMAMRLLAFFLTLAEPLTLQKLPFFYFKFIPDLPDKQSLIALDAMEISKILFGETAGIAFDMTKLPSGWKVLKDILVDERARWKSGSSEDKVAVYKKLIGVLGLSYLITHL